MAEALAAEGAKLNAWVTIGTDNTITILCPTSEMGQGVLTALPLILAEELDADWSKVKCEFAPGNPQDLRRRPTRCSRGAQVTLASVSVPGYYMPLRTAGAQARNVLLDNVAAAWNVPVAELTTEPSTVMHEKSGRRISYGEVAKFAKVPAEPPKIAESDLKKPSQFRLIGRKDIRPRRRALESQRHRQVRHRRAGAGHGLCLGPAVADGGRQGRGPSTPTR